MEAMAAPKPWEAPVTIIVGWLILNALPYRFSWNRYPSPARPNTINHFTGNPTIIECWISSISLSPNICDKFAAQLVPITLYFIGRCRRLIDNHLRYSHSLPLWVIGGSQGNMIRFPKIDTQGSLCPKKRSVRRMVA